MNEDKWMALTIVPIVIAVIALQYGLKQGINLNIWVAVLPIICGVFALITTWKGGIGRMFGEIMRND